jgi:alpha-tubulin suppressor-like RCC1 family protein
MPTDFWGKSNLPVGQLYVSGLNYYGCLGTGVNTGASGPLQVGALSDWYVFNVSSNGNFSFGVRGNGTLWATGSSGSYTGQLGLNDINISRSSPTQIGALTNWLNVAPTNTGGLAVKNNGTLWAWGRNQFGELGQSDTVARSSPVQIGALTNWEKVAGLSISCLAKKTDGTLWAWGWGSAGLIGDNTTINRSSPVQVGALTTWKNIGRAPETAFATNTSNQIFVFGSGNTGVTGLNSTINKSSPTQIGALTNWLRPGNSGQTNRQSFIKTDGTLWCVGYQRYGQFGINLKVYPSYLDKRSSPVQALGTDWVYSCLGDQAQHALKSTGTWWAVGSNSAFGAANAFSGYRSSWIQVGSATNWRHLSFGERSVACIND